MASHDTGSTVCKTLSSETSLTLSRALHSHSSARQWTTPTPNTPITTGGKSCPAHGEHLPYETEGPGSSATCMRKRECMCMWQPHHVMGHLHKPPISQGTYGLLWDHFPTHSLHGENSLVMKCWHQNILMRKSVWKLRIILAENYIWHIIYYIICNHKL